MLRMIRTVRVMRVVQATRMAQAMRAVRAVQSETQGFTLIEVAIAVAVLVTVLAGVGGVWVMTAASTRAAREQTMAMQLARDKLEQLAALTWAVRSVGGVDVLDSDVTTNVSRVPATMDGSGTGESPSDSLGASRVTYVDYLDARGRWLDTGLSPPGGSRFVRRWWLGRTGIGSSEMLMFQVRVATMAADAAGSGGGAGGWWRDRPGVVWLCGAKVRRRAAS